MILAVDIGNTSISIGGFDGRALIFHGKIATQLLWSAEQYAMAIHSLLALYQVTDQSVEGAIVSSVVPSLTEPVRQALLIATGQTAMLVSAGVRTGVNIKTDFPRQVGTDLVSAAVWAGQNCPMPCVLVLLETASTFVLLDEKGQMMGTAITAGVQLSLDALHRRAAQLPMVSVEEPSHGVIGRNTVDALRAGAIYGAASMVEGMVERMEQALGQPVYAAATGLHAAAIVPHCRRQIALEQTMILQGLALIWDKNHGG